MFTFAALSGLVASIAQVPTGMPVWQMNLSTIIMPCNDTGPTDPASTKGWGVIDFDWSNWKGTGNSDGWAKKSPMDCEERLALQVAMTTEVSPSTKVWVYRNSILALPWYTTVREKIEDPAYSAWFMPFPTPVPPIKQQGKANTTCDNTFNPPKCSMLFHDSVQTPGFPTGDGNCAPPGCDVGRVPIGAYLFNPASANVSINNQTFTEWFIDDYLFGKNGGANPNISGFFFDDQFNPGGATESAGSLKNLGLTASQGALVSEHYWGYMNTVYSELIKRGKFAWQLLWTGQKDCAYKNSYGCLGTTGTQILVDKQHCASQLRTMCTAGSQAQRRAMLFPFAGKHERGGGVVLLPEFEQDLTNFLLSRGPHAYLGHSWIGCNNWYTFPEALNADYGEPTGLCKETAPNSEIFERDWTKASVKMDCKSYTGTVIMKNTGESVFDQTDQTVA